MLLHYLVKVEMVKM